MKQQQTSLPSFMETFAFAQWVIKFPALTLLVITRKDLGYRLVSTLTLIPVFGLLAIVTVLATPGHEAAHPEHLLIFAGIGFANGIAQRIRRWRDVNNGVNHHTYYIGNSVFDFRWLPYFARRNRRAARYIEPLFWAGLGFALLPFSRALAVWLIFAALCLRFFENEVFQRQRNRDLDLMDSVIIAERQGATLEHYEQAQKPQQQTSTGIPTGLGEDIAKKISANKQNPSLN